MNRASLKSVVFILCAAWSFMVMGAVGSYSAKVPSRVSKLVAVASNVPANSAKLGIPLPMTSAKTKAVKNDLFQFRSGGHILGFKPDRVYLVGIGYALMESFVGAAKVRPVSASGKGESSSKSGAPPLGRVVYKDLWPGITLSYTAAKGGIAESTYTIAPGADVSKIRLKYNLPFKVEKNGSLTFKASGNGYFTQTAPVAWQVVKGKRVKVKVAFKKLSDDTVGFVVGKYDTRHKLVIDPVYIWHTFYGGGGDDNVQSVAIDSNNNLYLTGYTWKTWNGPNGQKPLRPFTGEYDIFVLKLNSEGGYVWHTFYGSENDDSGNGIAVDSNNNVYVTGYSSASWNGPNGEAPLHPYRGGWDIFVLKLTSTGQYVWHTFYGGSGDEGRSIAVDSNNDVYVTGDSWGSWNGPNGEVPLHPYSGEADIFVLKLTSTGRYVWHTFYGAGEGDPSGCNCYEDVGYGIAVDSNNNVYVTGYSFASWKGPSGQEPRHAFSGGGRDVVVLKLNSSGEYQWHTFYGAGGNNCGKGEDLGFGVAVDSNNDIYITGYSNAPWKGPQEKDPLNLFTDGPNAFVLKLNSDGQYQWHSFYSPTGWFERRTSITVDSNNNVYVTGTSRCAWDGPEGDSLVHQYSGGQEIFVLKLNSAGQYQWHSFYGSSGWDKGSAIAVGFDNNIYVAGMSYATWEYDNQFPLHNSELGGGILALKLASDGSYLWHTFYGTGGVPSLSEGNGIAVDDKNNIYVTGYSESPWNGPNGELPLHAFSGGGSDIFILKLSSTGQYLWHTFYGSGNGNWAPNVGGWDEDRAYSIALDSHSNIYVTGYSSATWNGPRGEQQKPLHAFNGREEIVVLKLTKDGQYLWHTFYGSAVDDVGYGVAIDSNDNVFVTGYSSATWSGPDNKAPLHPFTNNSNKWEIFVLRLDSDGQYLWHTFYGSGLSDVGRDIAIDSNDSIYVTGESEASWNGPDEKNPLHLFSGEQDIFVLKLAEGGEYVWHTFYGSDETDWGYGITTDHGNNVLITGRSDFSWNGPNGQKPLNPFNGACNIFVLKLNHNGQYLWHSFYGGDLDSGHSVVVDVDNNIYVTGDAHRTWNGPDGQRPLSPLDSLDGIFVLKLTSNGGYVWHSFYSSDGMDEGHSIAVGFDNTVCITGFSGATWNGPNGQQPLHDYFPYRDIVVLKLFANNQEAAVPAPPPPPAEVNVSVKGEGGVFQGGEVTLEWGEVRGATGYLIYNADTDQLVEWIQDGSATGYTFDNLPCGHTYRFYIRVHSDYGNSQPSKVITVQTPACSAGGSTENPPVSLVWPQNNAVMNYDDFSAADYLVVFAWNQVENAKGYLLWLKLDDSEHTPVEANVVLSAGDGLLIEAGDLAGIYFILDKAGWNSLVPYTVTWQVSALSDPEDLNSVMGSSEKYSFTFNEAP